MLKRRHGFTLVELLIVIVVIAILAAITVVAYTGIQERANNSARLSELTEWAKIAKIYRIQHGHDPIVTTAATSYCLGEGFPGNKCWNQNTSPSTEINAAYSTVSNLPKGTRKPVSANGNSLGPIVTYDSTRSKIVRIWTFFKGDGDCPANTTLHWRPASGGQYACDIMLDN